MGDKTESGRVRVVDRRWFTSDGEEREGAVQQPPPAAPPAPEPVAETAKPADVSSSTGTQSTPVEDRLSDSQVGVLDLIDFLAQQAVAFISGQVPGRGRDLVSARYLIDLLGVLQEKTKGQLSIQEARVLDDVLFQLRTLCLAPSR